MTDAAAAAGAPIPPGVIGLGRDYLHRASRLGEHLSAPPIAHDAERVERMLGKPAALEPDWPPPRQPYLVGAGALHSDVTPADQASYDAMLASLSPGAASDPERIAAEAQQWRLPVTPYRPDLNAAHDADPELPELADLPRNTDTDTDGATLTGRMVVDLTAMWAGPLATSLLAEAGARVIKVDPSRRPDGFSQRRRLYEHLNGNKDIVDLDLDSANDRSTFEGLVRNADLVIDSFSRRVMPNFGYQPAALRAISPRVATLSITAFPTTSVEANWVAFGSGVHAASGLGMTTGAPIAAPAYPDVLAGLRAFERCLHLLGCQGEPTPHVEVSLAGAIAPLVDASAQLLGPQP